MSDTLPIPYGDYIHYYETESEYIEDRAENYNEPWLSHTDNVEKTNYNDDIQEKTRKQLLATPLSFEIVSGGTLYWYTNDNGYAKTIEFKKNNDEWSAVTSSSANSGTTICTVVPGDVIQFRGNNAWYGNSGRYNKFVNSDDCVFYAYGNIMSLISSDNFVNTKTFTAEYALRSIFHTTNVMIRPERQLYFPAETLTRTCYIYMFYGCKKLNVGPELPATNLANECYQEMFANCTSLKTTPKLPATTLKYACYYKMFTGCTNIETIEELPATELANACYYYMFGLCFKLRKAPSVLPAMTVPASAYTGMFYKCVSLTIAPELPATTLEVDCYREMFSDCSTLEKVPSVLPARNLPHRCYYLMFRKCFKLKDGPTMVIDTIGDNSCRNLYYQCFNLTSATITCNVVEYTNNESFRGTFYQCKSFRNENNTITLSATGLRENTYYEMFYECTSLVNGPTTQMITGITGTGACHSMFRRCNSISACSITCTVPTLPKHAFYYMFDGCTALTDAFIDLESVTLGNGAYQYMFYNCYQLDFAVKPVISATTYGDSSTNTMFANCYSLTKAPDITVSAITGNFNLASMFENCSSLTFINFDLQVQSLNTSTLDKMFKNCVNIDLPQTFNMSQIVSVNKNSCVHMFYNCQALTISPVLNISTVSSTDSFNAAFYNCKSITACSVTCTAPSVNSTFYDTFYNCDNLETAYIDLESETVAGNGYRDMFRNCYKMDCATKPIVSVSNISSNSCCQYMFSECYSLTKAPDLVISAAGGNSQCQFMFRNCSSLTSCSITCTAPSVDSTFYQMFIGCINITNAFIDLESETVRGPGYREMFNGCVKMDCLTKPVISTTNLAANQCCANMFRNCYSLTKAPDLIISATTGVNQCDNMFINCSSLTSCSITCTSSAAPNQIFYQMFMGCTNLQDAYIVLEPTTVGSSSYRDMFRGCSNLNCSVRPVISGVTLGNNAYDAMFLGCSKLTKAPEIFAASIGTYAFSYMFYGCTSLTTVPSILPATTLTTFCCQYMFYGCTSLTTAPELPAATLVGNCYDAMFSGCTNLNYIKCLATNISATNSHRDWVSGVQTNSGTFVKAASMTGWPTGNNGIPTNWTIQDAA